MLDNKKIKELWKEIKANRRDMEKVYELGIELNKVEEVEGRNGWKDYVTDICGVDLCKEKDHRTARRCKRIARCLTVQKAIDAGSIDKAYKCCRFTAG